MGKNICNKTNQNILYTTQNHDKYVHFWLYNKHIDCAHSLQIMMLYMCDFANQRTKKKLTPNFSYVRYLPQKISLSLQFPVGPQLDLMVDVIVIYTWQHQTISTITKNNLAMSWKKSSRKLKSWISKWEASKAGRRHIEGNLRLVEKVRRGSYGRMVLIPTWNRLPHTNTNLYLPQNWIELKIRTGK